MTDLPSHPDTQRPDRLAPDQPIATGSRRRRVLFVAAVAALLVVFVVLHLTGVLGAEAH